MNASLKPKAFDYCRRGALYRKVRNWKYERKKVVYSRPPIHLLHHIKSILCYEEEGHVSYEEMDHKFGKIVIFSKQYKF